MMAKRLPETEGGHSLFFSPDGEWIGFGAQGAIYKALASGGSPVHVVDIDGTLVGGTWTDAGEIIFSTWPLGGYGDTEAHHGLFVVSADGGTPQRLSAADSSDGVIDHRTPFAVPGSDAVLVTLWPTSNLTADARVAVVSRSSGRVEPLLLGMAPQFTASGHLVYASASGSVLAQRFDLRRARPLDNPRSLLVNDAKDGAAGVFTAGGGWADFAVSADGTMLFMHGDEGSALDMADRSGAIVASPFQLAGISHLDKPRFSPDGRRIAFSVGVRTAQRAPTGAQGFEAIHAVYVVDLSTGTSQRLTLEGDSEHVAWTPTGDTVVYATDGKGLFLQPADRSAPARPVMQRDDMVMGALSMGRRYIAMAVETSSGIHDVYVAARDSADKAWRYVDTNFDEAAPSIAPNERWLAYSSDETGRPEIYVSALPLPGARTVVSIDGGTEPVWGREGRTLYYRSWSGGMVAVSVDIAGDRFVVGTREELFRVNGEGDVAGREYDVSPSGEQFVFVRTRGLGRRLGVVLNAITERD